MAYIQTVTGPIGPEQLGITMMHEHITWDQNSYQEDIDKNDPEQAYLLRPIQMSDLGRIRRNMHAHRDNARQLNADEAIPELVYYRNAGGCSMVDCSSIGIERDPEGDRRVSEKTGVQIILGTGMYKSAALPAHLRNMSVEQKAELFMKELKEGIGESDVKAGVLGEIGVSEEFPQDEKDVLCACAAAQHESGAAILIHQPGFRKRGHDILSVLEKTGANPDKTVLCHSDPAVDDIPYLVSLLQRKAVLSFDQFSYEFEVNIPGWKGLWLPRDIDRVRCIAKLCELGFSDRIVLSQDLSFKVCYVRYGGWGYAHVLTNIVPMLRKENVSEEDIGKMLIENPARVLAIE